MALNQTTWCVRRSGSGTLEFQSSTATAQADCTTQAAVLALQFPNVQFCVTPFQAGSIGTGPLLDAGQLASLASAVRQQPVVTGG